MQLKPLNKLDIVITIFNQEDLIERVLYGVFKNTTTNFNLILIFVGCTDKTKIRSFRFIKKYQSQNLISLITDDIPNLHETKSNNVGFKLAQTDYLITIQDDMVIDEVGWERRLTYPLRKFDDVLGVTARIAQDIVKMGANEEVYNNIAGKEVDTLTRDIFAVRDVINRGPVAFRVDYLKKLNYLNEEYAPCNLDDADLSLRAWTQYKWKVGAFWIKYVSKLEWGKTRENNDIGMVTVKSNAKNAEQIKIHHKNYLENGTKHTESFTITEKEIDYTIKRFSFFKTILHISKYPLRFDKRVIKAKWKKQKAKIIQSVKYPLVKLFIFCFGQEFNNLILKYGFKKTVIIFLKKIN